MNMEMEDLTGLARRLRSGATRMHPSAAATLSAMPSQPPAVPAPASPQLPRLPSPPSVEGSEMSDLTGTPLAPVIPKAGPVIPKAGRHMTSQAGAGGGGSKSNGVVPAILGVGAAIGTIHFGAGMFPDMFKGADGKIDRTRLNIGGIVAGVIVFLIAKYLSV
eukprot:jgi/Mesvir1/18614/Mv17123-RA.1